MPCPPREVSVQAPLLLHWNTEADMIRFLLAVLLALLVAFGTGVLLHAQSASAPPMWRISDAPAHLKSTISEADTLIVAQHSALLRQLSRGLAEGGPALAIQSCHLDATLNASSVARHQGVAIGRTSDRLRAPTNATRPWAAAIVSEYAGKKAASVDGFAADLGERVGVMRPIVMQPMCEGCHGSPDKIGTAVRTVLIDRYPRDRAVGFTTGEIRGWYWVEMPKGASRGSR